MAYQFEIRGSRGAWLVLVYRGTQVVHRRQFSDKSKAQKYVNHIKAKVDGKRNPQQQRQRPIRVKPKSYFG